MKDKRIKRWKSGLNAVQAAQYFHDMAANGWILDEVGSLLYTFREGEPQELRYRVLTLKDTPTGEELARYEAEGWKKVGSWEQEYVFVKERDIWTDEMLERQMVVEEIDRQIEREKESRKTNSIFFAVAMGIVLLLFFLQFGEEMLTENLAADLLAVLLPNFLIIFFGGWLAIRKLRKKRERMADGDSVSERDTDWRRQRIRSAAGITVFVLLFGWVIYYEMGWNEKIYDLPREISYGDVPAVRLEMLEDAALLRAGESVEEQKADMKEIYGAFTHWHTYDNSVKDHGNLLIVKEIETKQVMRKTAADKEIELTTDYYRFIAESLAKKQFRHDLDWENELFERDSYSGMRTVKEISDNAFDELHICRQVYKDESVIHILCREGRQTMELDYNGQAKIGHILKEAEKVFAAQTDGMSPGK